MANSGLQVVWRRKARTLVASPVHPDRRHDEGGDRWPTRRSAARRSYGPIASLKSSSLMRRARYSLASWRRRCRQDRAERSSLTATIVVSTMTATDSPPTRRSAARCRGVAVRDVPRRWRHRCGAAWSRGAAERATAAEAASWRRNRCGIGSVGGVPAAGGGGVTSLTGARVVPVGQTGSNGLLRSQP